MEQGSNLDTLKVRVEDYISHIYFDTQSCTPTSKTTEDYIIRLISKLIVSAYSVWYAFSEIIEFLRKRKEIRGLH